LFNNVSSTEDFSVAFTSQSTFVFLNLTFVAGDFFFTHNAASIVTFPVLSVVVGDFVVSYNVFLDLFQAPALKSITGVISIVGNNAGLSMMLSPLYQVICEGDEGPLYADLQGCTRVADDRHITLSSATAVTSSLLTYTSGHLSFRINGLITSINLPSLSTVAGTKLDFNTNTVLATITLPSLSTVLGILYIDENPSLTFVHLPKLTFIGNFIRICQNNAVFRIPTGPPNAPSNGLVVTGTNKGKVACFLQQGNATCTTVTCP
jgi:hypothetical protein